jgi:DNA-binding NtrC family response regulator
MLRKRETIGDGQWPERRGEARVLVENPDGAEQWALHSILAAAGHDVAVCVGPNRARGVRCPLVEDGRCALAEGADVVLSSLSLSQLESREVIRALRERLPATPVIVAAPPARATLYADTLEGCSIERPPLTVERVRNAISDATSSSSSMTPPAPR